MDSFETKTPLDEVNDRYFAALDGGKAVFVRENADGSLSYMDRSTFLLELMTTTVTIGTNRKGEDIKEELGRAWLKWPKRRYFQRGFTLNPAGCEPDQFNLWKGFGVQPRAGDWSLMRRHIREVICDGDAGLADYVVKWCGWKVQNPLGRPLVALVLRGEEGTGKGFFCDAIAKLFGNHAARVNSAEQVVGRFNAAMRGALLVWADEIYWADNNTHIGRLKGQITEEIISIERKGIDAVAEPNHAAFLFSTNAAWAIPAGPEARRFVVCNVSKKQMQQRRYFAALAAETERGGLAAMLHDLKAMDLGDFHPDRDRYATAALDEQKAETLRRSQTFAGLWLEMLEAGALPTGMDYSGGRVFVGTSRLLERLRAERRSDWVTAKAIGDAFRAMRFQPGKDRDNRGWVLPPLPEARAAFGRWQFAVAWGPETGWEIAVPARQTDFVEAGALRPENERGPF